MVLASGKFDRSRRWLPRCAEPPTVPANEGTGAKGCVHYPRQGGDDVDRSASLRRKARWSIRGRELHGVCRRKVGSPSCGWHRSNLGRGLDGCRTRGVDQTKTSTTWVARESVRSRSAIYPADGGTQTVVDHPEVNDGVFPPFAHVTRVRSSSGLRPWSRSCSQTTMAVPTGESTRDNSSESWIPTVPHRAEAFGAG